MDRIVEHYAGSGPAHLVIPLEKWFYGNHVTHVEAKGAHDHNYLELAFVLSGKAKHVTIDGHETCGRGDLLVIPPGAWHSYGELSKLELVNCLLSPAMLQGELAWLATDDVLAPALGLSLPGALQRPTRWRVPESRMRQIRPLLFDLLRARQRGSSKVELLGYILLLLAQVRTVMAAATTVQMTSSQMHPSVARGIEMLHGSLAEQWSLGVLAARLRLNPSYLVRLFRMQTGMPPMKYLDKLRATRAATLLFSSDMPIGQIGEQVGWAEPKLFARQFRQHFGQSATAYRATLLGK